MMNGELMQDALSGKPGSFLGDCIEQASRQAGHPKSTWSTRSTWPPSAATRPARSCSRPGTTSRPSRQLQVLQDLFWALLNSNEFILIH